MLTRTIQIPCATADGLDGHVTVSGKKMMKCAISEVELAAREVVALWHETRLSDRKGSRLYAAVERLTRALKPHPDIAEALEWLEERDSLLQRCPDGGKCHHRCRDRCWRVIHCGPLSGVYPGDDWPDEIRKQHETETEMRQRRMEQQRAELLVAMAALPPEQLDACLAALRGEEGTSRNE